MRSKAAGLKETGAAPRQGVTHGAAAGGPMNQPARADAKRAAAPSTPAPRKAARPQARAHPCGDEVAPGKTVGPRNRPPQALARAEPAPRATAVLPTRGKRKAPTEWATNGARRSLRSRHSSPVATGGPGPSEGEPDKLVSSPSSSPPSSSHNEDDDEDDEDDENDDEDDDDSEANDSLVKDGPRKQTQVNHYVPDKASKKAKVVAAAPAKVPQPKPAKAKRGQKRVPTDKSCAPGVDPKAPFGRNKNGKPYKRACGAYKQSLHPPGARTSTPATESGYSKLVTDLRAANEVLTNKLAIAESEVARLKAVEGSAERLARLEGERDKHKEFHDAFMQGLDKGLSMASGQLVVTSGAPASGRAGRSL